MKKINKKTVIKLNELSEYTKLDIIVDKILLAIKRRSIIYTCGNGGSAALAQHLTSELMCRYKLDRMPISSICLSSDVTLLTSISNDYGFENIFSRQINALCRPNDILICFTTSGKSENIINAICMSSTIPIESILFCGVNCSTIVADIEIIYPDVSIDTVQENHLRAIHYIVDKLEKAIVKT